MLQFKFQKKLFKVSHTLEIAVGIIATIPIFIAIAGMIVRIFTINYFEDGVLLLFIQRTIEIIIGIEFIKLIFVHTIDSTIEVIIMAVMRQIIMVHTAMDTLILSIAICLLFMVRKFLFIRELDKIDFLPDHNKKYKDPSDKTSSPSDSTTESNLSIK